MIVFSFVENAYIFGIDKIIQRQNKKIKCIPIIKLMFDLQSNYLYEFNYYYFLLLYIIYYYDSMSNETTNRK